MPPTNAADAKRRFMLQALNGSRRQKLSHVAKLLNCFGYEAERTTTVVVEGDYLLELSRGS
jgi:hypothetical protein